MRMSRTIGVCVVAVALTAGAAALQGCALVIGAGAAVGVAAVEERGLEQGARDLRITTEIREKWLRKDHTMLVNLAIETYEGRVLLTGITPDPEVQAEAVDLTWKVEGVKEVLNEIIVTPKSSLLDTANDVWIDTQLSTKLTFDKEVSSINYVHEVVNGTVYLIGIARDQRELDRVIGHARNISHVKRVVSHVRVKTAA